MGKKMELRPWQAEVGIWCRAAGGLLAESSPSLVGPGGPGAWAHAWPGLRGQDRLPCHPLPPDLRRTWAEPS